MGSIHLVQTERYGKDKASDWVAVKDVQEAERIWHGGEIREILWVGNRLRDFKQNAKDQ